MRFTIIKITIGLVLVGCTINPTHYPSDRNASPPFSISFVVPNGNGSDTRNTSNAEPAESIESVDPVEIAKSKCKTYVPLPVPKPARINLEELKATRSTKELNAVLLRNVKQLHGQLTTYAKQADKHYKDYLRKCGSK